MMNDCTRATATQQWVLTLKNSRIARCRNPTRVAKKKRANMLLMIPLLRAWAVGGRERGKEREREGEGEGEGEGEEEGECLVA